jgi:hypothetical protein
VGRVSCFFEREEFDPIGHILRFTGLADEL